MQYTPVKRIGELMPELFKDPKIAAKIAEGSLPEAWQTVTGDFVAQYTSEISFRKGIMTVHISSAAMRSELFMQRSQLRDKVNAQIRVPIVRELIVR